MKRIIRATTDERITRREIDNAALARKIAADGTVLLENDGVLPIKPGKIALYGYGARHTGFGGSGSGENRPRYKVNAEEGLKKSGFEITTKSWLDDFDRAYEGARETWKKDMTAGLKTVPKLDQMDYASAHRFVPPLGRRITEEDVLKSETDTAVYVLTRLAGEGDDREAVEGDYYIREAERAHLRFISAHYEKVILILNIGSIMDLGFLDDGDINVNAVVYSMQGGMELGNALADVLTGAYPPSGKLTDTWAERYEDYPSYDTFSTQSGNSHIEEYREGIFIGYRWFDSWKIKPRYPFGYGLTYTSFSVNVKSAELDGTALKVCAEAANTGKRPGREVVQLYMSAPRGELQREKKSLAAYAKTKMLEPGESEELTLTYDLREAAGYSYDRAAFILEKGTYRFGIGTSSANLAECAGVILEKTVETEKVAHICPVVNPFKLTEVPDPEGEPFETADDGRQASVTVSFSSEGDISGGEPGKSSVNSANQSRSDIKLFHLMGNEFTTVSHLYETPAYLHDPKLDAAFSHLKENDMIKLLVGTSYFGAVHNTVFGAGGRTTSEFLKYGIPDMPMSDGPQGLNLLPRNLKPMQNLVSMPALPEMLSFRNVKTFTKLTVAEEGDKRRTYYQFCTAFPCETLVAQTWDKDLAKEEGRAVACEMREFGVVFWLAPAMNIHRNPLCGRNYEYYSEDPLLSGKTAAAVTRGVQSADGCFVTLKHFCCNNLEHDRNRSDSRIDERTLREIYLKNFRYAIKEGNAQGVMSSYNMVNGTYLANNYDLLTKVLRNEWGFKGLVMTDWFGTGHGDALDEVACHAGNDLIMPGVPGITGKIRAALKSGVISHEDVERAARRVVYYAVHSNVAEQ